MRYGWGNPHNAPGFNEWIPEPVDDDWDGCDACRSDPCLCEYCEKCDRVIDNCTCYCNECNWKIEECKCHE